MGSQSVGRCALSVITDGVVMIGAEPEHRLCLESAVLYIPLLCKAGSCEAGARMLVYRLVKCLSSHWS